MFFTCWQEINTVNGPLFSSGGPTNIYIQGLDSVGQLSTEIRLLKEENLSLQNQLKQATRGTFLR